VLSILAGCGAAAHPASPLAGEVPSLDYDVLARAGDAPSVRPDDERAVELQKQLLTFRDGSAEQADLFLQVAQLEAARWREEAEQERALDQKIAGTQGDEKRTLIASQLAVHRRGEQAFLAAVQAYAAASKIPGYQRRDEALFGLATVLHQSKRDDRAREPLHSLLTQCPTSRRVPESYLFFGDYYFAKADWKAAFKFYDRVLTFEGAPVEGYALYKQAWCWLRLGDVDRAAVLFDQSLAATREGRAGNAGQAALLAEAAQRDRDKLRR